MILKESGYGYNDITIIPAMYSNVKSRSECNPLISNNLPIFVAPMSSVIDDNNYIDFINNNCIPIIPRNIKLDKRIELANKNIWIAISLNEFKDFILNKFSMFNISNKLCLCIDVANGHMKQIYDLSFKAKHILHDKLSLMVGNIANPNTYLYINSLKDKDGSRLIDFVRCGIGGGSGCIADGTLITTNSGEIKKIEDVIEGDTVLTIDGTYQKVISTIRYKCNNLLKINDNIICTPDHKFFVIEKSNNTELTFKNLKNNGQWISADNLNKDKHLLVKINLYVEQLFIADIFNPKIELEEIQNVVYIHDVMYVNDLTIENNHNYVANNYLVHNCITSSNTSIHYPQASLIDACNKFTSHGPNDTMIIADGGIRNYSDVIKALALGADYIMIGGLFSKCLESCGEKYIYNIKTKDYKLVENQDELYQYWNDSEKDKTFNILTAFYGMASAQGQIAISGKKTKTSEGISKFMDVQYTLSQWTNNMKDYIKSAMSYCNCFNLNDFIGKQNCIVNSNAEINAVNK